MTSYHRGCSVVEGEGLSCFKLREIYFATTELEALLCSRADVGTFENLLARIKVIKRAIGILRVTAMLPRRVSIEKWVKQEYTH